MKRRRKQRLTFVFIPDVSRPVRRARFPRHLLSFIPLVIVLFVSSAVYWHFARINEAARALAALDSWSQEQQHQLAQTLQERNRTIAELEEELAELSLKVSTVLQELERIRQLEKEIRLLAGLPPGNPVTISSAHLTTDMERLESALREVKDALLEEQRIRDHTPSLWPTRSRLITSRFGMRIDPFSGKSSFHSGIDIAGELNAPVYASAEGYVEETGYDRERGYYIIINHRIGYKTRYMHLNRLLAEKGDEVGKGETIGLIGSTGKSTGPHLHYEVWHNHQAVNPQAFLQEVWTREGGS